MFCNAKNKQLIAHKIWFLPNKPIYLQPNLKINKLI